jgi:hypothetical protein
MSLIMADASADMWINGKYFRPIRSGRLDAAQSRGDGGRAREEVSAR